MLYMRRGARQDKHCSRITTMGGLQSSYWRNSISWCLYCARYKI